MPTEESHLLNLKNILGAFSVFTGLKVNFSNSSIVPINVDHRKKDSLASVLDCQVGSMPFTYLALPLGTTRPSVDDFLPLLNRNERRMMGISSLLSYAGRLIMVNSVLSALPTYYLGTLKLPVTMIHQIDKYRKHRLWDRGVIHRKGGCLVAWKKACLPKNQGRLGIINLRIQNTALLLKHLHKFCNHEIIPWVTLTWRCLYNSNVVPQLKRPVGSFWLRDVMSCSSSFLMIASCKARKGNSICFWSDTWDLGVLKWRYPQLFSFAKNQNISLQKFLSQDAYTNFFTPLSEEAANQWTELDILIQSLELVSSVDDRWSYI
jgi:hypothetical protein